MFANNVSTMEEEQTKLTTLRSINPTLANTLLQSYTAMVDAATAGSVVDILKLVQTSQGPPPIWFKIKMFQQAVLNVQLPVLKFMVEQGFTIDEDFKPLTDIIFDLMEANKNDRDRSLPRDKLYAQTMMFLVVKLKQDVNKVRKDDPGRLSPIHIAAKFGLTYMCLLLQKVGADVNSVGRNDEMPLLLAEEAKEVGTVKVLEKIGAKRTWRKDVVQITPSVMPPAPPKMKTKNFPSFGVSERIETTITTDADEAAAADDDDGEVVREADGGFTFSCG